MRSIDSFACVQPPGGCQVLGSSQDAVLEEERAQCCHGRGQVGRAVLDRDREGVVDPVGKTRRTSRGAEEEVGHLRVQV